jgi:hypothetical protein
MMGKLWSRLIMAGGAMALLAGTAAAQSVAGANSDIVVRGVRSKFSNWRQAETSHVVMLSDGSEEELVRLARNLERLHFLLSGLMGRGAVDDDTVKIHITLIGEVAQFDAMDLHNVRWQQGPFNDLFQIGRYYDPRADGAVMASIRADQRVVVEHTPVNAQSVGRVLSSLAMSNPDPNIQADMLAATDNIYMMAGMKGPHDSGITFGEKDMTMSEESLLYAGYAQHFLLTYFPAAYPRWYLDGFGQIFATMAVKGDNVLEFGRTPDGTTAVMHSFGPYPIKDVLEDAYLTQPVHSTGWTPIHAWMLTHYLFFSDKRRPQLRQYLAMRAQGVDAATAAKVFGDRKELGHEIGAYFLNRKPYLQITYDSAKIDQPIVRRLRESEASFVKGRLELGARVEIPSAPAAGTPLDKAKSMIAAREDALRQRAKWLDGLRRDAARYTGELEAQLLLSEAECRSGNPAECLAAAGRAEVIAPNDPRVLVWKAIAMVGQAAAVPAEEREPQLAAARALIVRANETDHEAIGPLLAYYESFARTGEAPTVSAIDGLQKAMEEVPAAPETRLELAGALVQRGQYAVARPVIMPVAAGAYDTPERTAAQALLGRIDAAVAAAPAASKGSDTKPAPPAS